MTCEILHYLAFEVCGNFIHGSSRSGVSSVAVDMEHQIFVNVTLIRSLRHDMHILDLCDVQIFAQGSARAWFLCSYSKSFTMILACD